MSVEVHLLPRSHPVGDVGDSDATEATRSDARRAGGDHPGEALEGDTELPRSVRLPEVGRTYFALLGLKAKEERRELLTNDRSKLVAEPVAEKAQRPASRFAARAAR